MGSGNAITFIYERVTRGFGDSVFLRVAILQNIKEHPSDNHVLIIYGPAAPIFVDIENLVIHKVDRGTVGLRMLESSEIIKKYSNVVKFNLSSPCVEYEVANQPNVFKSRQEIFCDVVGVEMSQEYGVVFTDEEEDFADDFLCKYPACAGVHMWSADRWRDYWRIPNLVELLANNFDGYVICFDRQWRYTGRKKNIISCSSNDTGDDIRKSWAVMSRMLFGVGPDSWGVHAFGSVGVPLYGIFGPTNPRYRLLYPEVYWSPEYKRCNKQYCWYKPCADKITGKRRFPCLNSRTSLFYLKDIKRKLGRFF